MKRLADASEPPVVVPVVVALVDVHVALVVPTVERGEVCKIPSMTPPLEILSKISGLNIISHHNAPVFCTKYLHFFEVSTYILRVKP
nr:hypothetical protein [uncultured archaeon]